MFGITHIAAALAEADISDTPEIDMLDADAAHAGRNLAIVGVGSVDHGGYPFEWTILISLAHLPAAGAVAPPIRPPPGRPPPPPPHTRICVVANGCTTISRDLLCAGNKQRCTSMSVVVILYFFLKQ